MQDSLSCLTRKAAGESIREDQTSPTGTTPSAHVVRPEPFFIFTDRKNIMVQKIKRTSWMFRIMLAALFLATGITGYKHAMAAETSQTCDDNITIAEADYTGVINRYYVTQTADVDIWNVTNGELVTMLDRFYEAEECLSETSIDDIDDHLAQLVIWHSDLDDAHEDVETIMYADYDPADLPVALYCADSCARCCIISTWSFYVQTWVRVPCNGSNGSAWWNRDNSNWYDCVLAAQHVSDIVMTGDNTADDAQLWAEEVVGDARAEIAAMGGIIGAVEPCDED